MRKQVVVILIVSLVLFSVNAFANKTSVTIEGPESAAKGSEVTIKINVRHDGNNFFHYTNQVYVKANGKEIARWDFSATSRPENEVFTKEVKLTLTEPTEIVAEGVCNIHGSEGPAVLKIRVE
ncbi:desulfoferrodoxin family protein [Desulfatitalea tepidiphila]|uniref:desulfoferrodoxin family protein n=1 Tax=Desulfatitalea tepidiphila TaxID=1185843 RepID=UPI0006B67791|nr:desulfoferrodoxin family protein [Desulfatitalea tepidiphila]